MKYEDKIAGLQDAANYSVVSSVKFIMTDEPLPTGIEFDNYLKAIVSWIELGWNDNI